VTVHNAECPFVLSSDVLRQINVEWDAGISAPRRVRITVHSQDQLGLLALVTQAITTLGVNIASAQIRTEHGKAVISFELTVTDAKQLQKIKRAIEMVPGVIKVERVRHLSGPDDGSGDREES
jgi:(p)ppGpp synthase/HD superfamily hydrolase